MSVFSQAILFRADLLVSKHTRFLGQHYINYKFPMGIIETIEITHEINKAILINFPYIIIKGNN